jgi:glyoxylase-like metal-dependent hydrolase (beta-lactamase superfamily II)
MMGIKRRTFLKTLVGGATAVALPTIKRVVAETQHAIGGSTLTVISDGNLVLPAEFIQPPNMSGEDFEAFKRRIGLNEGFYRPDCNITVWKSGDRTVIFDVGAGENFMDSAGQLLSNLEQAGIAAEDVTDVVISHAHPDHLWGLVDDFDELVFYNAEHHVHQIEWDYWLSDTAMNDMPESRKVFALGAKARFAYLEDSVRLFGDGEEFIPGVQAMFTPGHTPGHCSFRVYQEQNSAVIIGDALLHPILSFAPGQWLSGSDQNPMQAQNTRKRLLDQLAQDKSALVGFHLPYPGLGYVERRNNELYQFSPMDV